MRTGSKPSDVTLRKDGSAEASTSFYSKYKDLEARIAAARKLNKCIRGKDAADDRYLIEQHNILDLRKKIS